MNLNLHSQKCLCQQIKDNQEYRDRYPILILEFMSYLPNWQFIQIKVLAAYKIKYLAKD